MGVHGPFGNGSAWTIWTWECMDHLDMGVHGPFGNGSAWTIWKWECMDHLEMGHREHLILPS
eukprot:1161053-Pelagomonas_calceolata.AAC.16